MYQLDNSSFPIGHGFGETSLPFVPLRPPSPALAPAALATALAQNLNWAARMGWDILYDAISSWILGFQDATPDPAAFARSVAIWQSRNRLAVDGILGPATWAAMIADVRAGIPRPFLTPEGVRRPHGLVEIVNAFGNPTEAGWEKANLVNVAAPASRSFAPGRKTLPVHRRLARQFASLFDSLDRAGLWQEIVPTDGTFLCRTKFQFGRQRCGTPGLRFDQLSTHSWGITIDIRSADYPFYTPAMRQAGARLRIPPPTVTNIFQRHGFHFGLWFLSGRLDRAGRIILDGADPMHFQFATGY